MPNNKAQALILTMKKAGGKSLHILSDFDRTLTKSVVRGKEVSSLISVLRDGKYLSPDYATKAHALYNFYHAIEMDPRVSREEKKKKMEEWWSKHFSLLIASGLTKDDVKRATESRGAELREDAKEFFALLQSHNIPLVIMSSGGLGVDSIRMFLEHNKVNLQNVHIISNQYIWDKNGKALRVKDPITHSMNKDETLVKNFPDIFQHIKDRKNVILIGDHAGDLDMITGFDYEHLLSIEFTDEQNGFDISLPTDSSFDPVTKILREILP